MKTLRLSFIVASMVAFSTLFFCSCNKENGNQIETSMDNVNSFYSASVLKSSAIKELPDYTSKEEIANMVLGLAKEKFNADEVQITDLYLYPDFGGVELFYKSPNGIEANALLVDINSIGDIVVDTDQFEVTLDDSDSDLILGNDYALLEKRKHWML